MFKKIIIRTKMKNITKVIYMIILFIVLTSCESNKIMKQKLVFIENSPIFSDYDFLTFKNERDSLVFILSNKIKNQDIKEFQDTLRTGDSYYLILNDAPKGIYLTTGLRHKPAFVYDDYNRIITKNDTLVGTVYTSPNINGLYYKK